MFASVRVSFRSKPFINKHKIVLVFNMNIFLLSFEDYVYFLIHINRYLFQESGVNNLLDYLRNLESLLSL